MKEKLKLDENEAPTTRQLELNGETKFLYLLKALALLELDISHVKDIPVWFSQFANIIQLVIKSEKIDFSNNFWNNEYLKCLKIRVNPDFKNLDFINYFKNLSHLWIEISELKDLPNIFEKFIKNNISLKIYKGNMIRESLEEYLKTQAPGVIILKVHSDCKIPDNLKQYLINN